MAKAGFVAAGLGWRPNRCQDRLHDGKKIVPMHIDALVEPTLSAQRVNTLLTRVSVLGIFVTASAGLGSLSTRSTAQR